VHTTYRVISGVSMGAIGTSALGLSNPNRFDAVAPLGGPLDAAFFSRMMDRFVVGGFCTRGELEALLAQDPLKLNDPAIINACSKPVTPMTWEQHNDFNHWHVTNSGGAFDRDTYLRMFSDLTLAYGNFYTDNPNSPYGPPGVDPEKLRHFPADFCTNPTRVKGLKNAEYNADGKYDAITFCDGQPTVYFCATGQEPVNFCSDPANLRTPLPVARELAFANAYCANKGGAVEATKSEPTALYWLKHAGLVDPCREATNPVGMMLAYDYNGNGRRDYGEPVVNNSHERYDDLGADGCASAFEDGKGGCTTAGGAAGDPNGDDFDASTNPNGTENDFAWEQGEPFRDLGLDGVAGTSDSGEGNGQFDQVAGRKRLIELDGRTNFKKLDAAGKKRLNLLTDGGIRDIFNLGLMAKHWFSAVLAERGAANVGVYRNFTDIPGMTSRSGNYDPWNHAWAKVPKDLITLYGKEQPTDEDLVNGEGDHVGTPGEAANRFQTVFNWVAAQWPNLARPATPPGSDVVDGQRVESFQSQKLKAKWEYAIALPPGYDDPANKDARYPVTYMLHGYGMSPRNFMGTAVLTDVYVKDVNVQLRPVIYVFPNGRCCYVNPTTGARDCRNLDDAGNDLNLPGYERECNSGTFYVNRLGYTANDAVAYGDAFFELMDHIDATYRTLPAADVTAR
jgi:S-formylglutathione hydrolase FrmB